MSTRKKYCLYGLVGVLSLILICTLCYLIRERTTKNLSYTTELKVVDINGTKEIRVLSKDMCKYYYENGENVKKLSSIPKVQTNGILELPDATESYDIESKEESVSDMTWDSTLQTSSNYIEYLKLSGYTSVLTIHKIDSIELFLEKGSVRKRVVIFNNSIMIGNLIRGYELPNIDVYFK